MTRVKSTPPPRQKSKLKNGILAVLLVAAISITAAFAFLTASETSENLFTVGNVDVELTESKWDANNPDGILEDIVPGQVIEKDPTITNVGANDAYTYIMVSIPKVKSVPIVGEDGTTTTMTDYPLFSFEVNDGWTLVESQVGTDTDAYDYYVYAYDEALVPDDPDVNNETSSSTLFDEIVFANVTSEYAEQVSNNGSELTVSVTGYAIQSELDDNITGPVDAWRLCANQNNWGFPQNSYPLSFSNFRLVLDGGAIKVDNSDELNDENSSMYAVFSSGSELLLTDEEYDIAYQEFEKYEDKTYTLDVTYNSTELGTINDTVTASSSNNAWYGYRIDDALSGYWVSGYEGDQTVLNLPAEIDGKPVYGVHNYDDSKMTSVTMAGIENVTEINLPVNSEGYYAVMPSSFSGCTNLKIVNFEPSNTTSSISSGTFNGCTSLETVNLPNYIEKIEPLAFKGCSKLDGVILPNSLKSIEDYAFENCSSLSNIIIPNSVTSIQVYAFNKCASLLSATISNGVTEIPNGAFSNCTKLTSVKLPNNLTTIGSQAFSMCGALTGIKLPDTVTSLGTGAFEYCSSLTSITIPAGVTVISDSLFQDCGMPTYAPNAHGLTEVIILGNVTSIGKDAFNRCWQLSEINLPDSITSIGNSAFNSCISLKSIDLPDNLITIGSSAFNNGVFTSLVLPDKVQTINTSAFGYCASLTEVTVPSSVTKIASNAFKGCSKIADVYYTGTESDWSGINISTGNETLTGASIHYGS